MKHIDPRDARDNFIRAALRRMRKRGLLPSLARVAGFELGELRDLMYGSERLTVEQRSALIMHLD